MPISGSNYTLPTNSFAQPVNGQRFDATAGAATLDDIATALDALVDGSGQAAGSLANAKLANMAEATIKGRASGAGTGVPTDLTADQVRTIIDPQLGDYLSSESTAVARTLKGKADDILTIKDFGAVGDGVTDDTAAFVAAIARQCPVFIPEGEYLLDPEIELKSGAHLYGPTPATAGSTLRTARLLFTGTADYGFFSPDGDAGEYLNQGGLSNLMIATETGAQIKYIIDIRGPISWHFSDIRLENNWSDGGGFRSRALSTDLTTWLNRMTNCEVRIDDASTRYALDIDWSDGSIVGGAFSGGLGSTYRGPGNIHFLGAIFDRANSGGAGLTLSKELSSVGTITICSCAFDLNETYGVVIRANSSPSGTVYMPSIVNCGFRNPGATADVYFNPTVTGRTTGPQISGCAFGESGVTPVVWDDASWDVNLGPNVYANTSWLSSTFFGSAWEQANVVDYKGINLSNAPIVVRHSMTFRSAANVAAAIGANTSDSPMVIVGALNGATPFIGASQTAAGSNTGLAFVTGNSARLFLSSDGGQFRPQSNTVTSLGAASLQWTNVYTRALSLGDGVSEPGTETGRAVMYVDSADGDLKIKFADGTIKTIVTDT